jgi:hypothetical protein
MRKALFLAAALTVAPAHASSGGSQDASAALQAAASASAKPSNATPTPTPNANANANANGNAGQNPMMEANLQPFPDASEPAADLPKGAIDVEIRDAADKPRAKVKVTLGIVQNSVAKGENRRQESGVTDESGHVQWNNLEQASQFSYRISVSENGGQFAAAPFQLDPAKGQRVVVHTYPVVSDISKSLVVMQGIVYVELKDDRIQIQQAFNMFNFGKTAWVPRDYVVALPTGFTALTGVQQMSDQSVEAVEGSGAAFRGTYGPGRHAIEYRWQLPYNDEPNIDLSIAMPGNLAAARVMVVSSSDMKVSVDNFPPVQAGRDGQGNAIVETEREMRREDAPLKTIRIQLRDIPVPGPARYVATALAALGILLGIGSTLRGKPDPARAKSTRKKDRERLLHDLEDLERAHRAGDIGPKTYENSRRELIDAIARLLASDPKAKAAA